MRLLNPPTDADEGRARVLVVDKRMKRGRILVGPPTVEGGEGQGQQSCGVGEEEDKVRDKRVLHERVCVDDVGGPSVSGSGHTYGSIHPTQSNHTPLGSPTAPPLLPHSRSRHRRPPKLPTPPFIPRRRMRRGLAARLCRNWRRGVAPRGAGAGGGLPRRGRGMVVSPEGRGCSTSHTVYAPLDPRTTNTTHPPQQAVASPAHILGDHGLLLKHLNPHTVALASAALVPAAEGGAAGNDTSSGAAQHQQGPGAWVVGLWHWLWDVCVYSHLIPLPSPSPKTKILLTAGLAPTLHITVLDTISARVLHRLTHFYASGPVR